MRTLALYHVHKTQDADQSYQEGASRNIPLDELSDVRDEYGSAEPGRCQR
jgi:hypothetical protein